MHSYFCVIIQTTKHPYQNDNFASCVSNNTTNFSEQTVDKYIAKMDENEAPGLMDRSHVQFVPPRGGVERGDEATGGEASVRGPWAVTHPPIITHPPSHTDQPWWTTKPSIGSATAITVCVA